MGPKNQQKEERRKPWVGIDFTGGCRGGGGILVVGGVLIAAAFAAHRARVRGKRSREESASRSVHEQYCKENEEKVVEKSNTEKRFGDIFVDDELLDIKQSAEIFEVKSNGRDGNSRVVFGESQNADVAEMVEKDDGVEGEEGGGEEDAFVETNGNEDEGREEVVKKEEEFNSREAKAFVIDAEVKQVDRQEANEEETEIETFGNNGLERKQDSREAEKENVDDGQQDKVQLISQIDREGHETAEEAAQEEGIPIESHGEEGKTEGQEVMVRNSNEETKTFASAVREAEEENLGVHYMKEDMEQFANRTDGKELDSDEAAVEEEAAAEEAHVCIEGTKENEVKESNAETDQFSSPVDKNLVDSIEAKEENADVKSNNKDIEQFSYKMEELEPVIDQLAAAEEAQNNETHEDVDLTEEDEVKEPESSRETVLEETEDTAEVEEGDAEEGTPQNEFHETEESDKLTTAHIEEVEEKEDGSEEKQVNEFVVNGEAQSLVNVVMEKHTDLQELKEENVHVNDGKEDTEQLAYEMAVKEDDQEEALPNVVQAKEIEPLFNKADHVHGGEEKGCNHSHEDSDERQGDSEEVETAAEIQPQNGCEENAMLLVDDVVQNNVLADNVKEAETNKEHTKLLVCEDVQHDDFKEVNLTAKKVEDKKVCGKEARKEEELQPDETHEVDTEAEEFFSRAASKEEGCNAALFTNFKKIEENQQNSQEDDDNEDKKVKGNDVKTSTWEENEAKTHAEADSQVQAVQATKATKKATMKMMTEIEKSLDAAHMNQFRVAFLLALFLVIALGLLSYHQHDHLLGKLIYQLAKLLNKNAS